MAEKVKFIELYHNKRCSKSNQALSHLKSLGWSNDNMNIVLYLENGLTTEQVERIVEGLPENYVELIRTSDAKKLGIDIPKEMNKSWVIEQLVIHPQIMQRPIIVAEGKVIIARTIDKINSLFS